MSVTDDERASARLLFGPELASGSVRESLLARREVRTATTWRRVPSSVARAYQARLVRRGALGFEDETLPRLLTARERVLGAEAAAGPPRLLVRCGVFPGTAADHAARATLVEAGVPFLVAVDPGAPLHEAEREELGELRRAGVAFGALGAVAAPKDLTARLDRELATLAEAAVRPETLVPIGGEIAWKAWPEIAARFSVVCGEPASVRSLGWHDVPSVRAGAVWLPALAPFAGRAAEAVAGARRLAERGAAIWVGVSVAPSDDVAAFARGAGAWCVDWDRFADAARVAVRG